VEPALFAPPLIELLPLDEVDPPVREPEPLALLEPLIPALAPVWLEEVEAPAAWVPVFRLAGFDFAPLPV
jgi:hypothetical protein